jgi:uncharacterized protein YjdB
MGYTEIDKAINTAGFGIAGNIVVKTIRDGYSGIFNQHTFSVKDVDGVKQIVEDGADGSPVILIEADKVHAIFNTNIDRYNPAKIETFTPTADSDATNVALRAFKEFAYDEFSFPAYNVCVQEILVDGDKVAVVITVTGVTLDKATASVNVGAKVKATATIAPTNATNKAMTFKSSDEKIATVGTDGTITGVAAGTANVTVTTTDGAKTAVCAVTVTAP